MALIPGHDYITITHWRCPHCHKEYHGRFHIGRFFGDKLFCSQGCAQYFYHYSVKNVSYEDEV